MINFFGGVFAVSLSPERDNFFSRASLSPVTRGMLKEALTSYQEASLHNEWDHRGIPSDCWCNENYISLCNSCSDLGKYWAQAQEEIDRKFKKSLQEIELLHKEEVGLLIERRLN